MALSFGCCFFLRADSPVAVLQANAFDNSHFLFPEQNKMSILSETHITEGAFLEPTSPAFLVSSKTMASVIDFGPKKEAEQYLVQKGDTVSSVAEKFGISLNTLFWANNLTSKSTLKEGQELVVLPVTGMLHIVKQGDTLSQIALLYKVKSSDVIEFNELGEDGNIQAGDFLIIPNAQKPKETPKYVQVPLSQSFFMCPVPAGAKISQGLHWYNAVDFGSLDCGQPVFAAAGGTVQRTGFGQVGGNFARILHSNGTVTYYGHLSKIAVSPQQAVSQGQIIGYIGYTGIVYPKGPDGCHLHFEVFFAKNPFAGYAVGASIK